MLHSFDWQLVTAVSGQDIDSFFKDQTVLIRPILKLQAVWNA
jgi:3-methyladenine DNA glycosylase Tag